ncbi:hypothetical protein C351_05419 [Cryptococcus neoformans c8]|nr:hypothetical protein C353_05572 [Cryptococcus neoformans var. grubii AD1-83a]OXG51325.1 hypothetical protein C354_05513 [Cryptococcus neoformans var. grubii MW-RSA1955]OXG55354.1 hypothetical protein C352_05495 [Cryptococcus neoformans var. grubii CHC193]OXG59134.1 hypothetical protein C351_05419 [Cryptococcus neoformans var. grubii c8]OXH04358.1 hypothetical protein C369_05699 [Cryptococcus neoformans var. grubii A5-35-17]OXH05750.1 hypothetical protein C370_05785 [Cryptococcus neoformans 
MPIAISTSQSSLAGSPPAPAPLVPPAPRNPVRLSVAARDHPQPSAGPSSARVDVTSIPSGDVSISPPGGEDAEALKRAAIRKAQLQRRVERWMDKLMEETVDRATFKKTVPHFTPPQYLEITHERHLNSLCSYPVCPNPPYRPYSSSRRFVISTRARTIKPKEGNEEEGYCSKKCKAKSGWIEGKLDREAVWLRGKVEDIELLEELEERGEVDLEAMMKEEPKTATRKDSIAKATPSPVPKPALPPKQIISNLKQPLASEASVPPPSANAVTTLIESLTIHERPISSVALVPPSLSGRVDHSTSIHALPAVEPQPLPLPQPQPQSSLSSHARRNPNSLLSPSSTLTRSLLSATNSIPAAAISQSSPHGDDSEEEESEASEWEKEMSFGEETEEVKGWFEEAMAAREMLGDKEETEK